MAEQLKLDESAIDAALSESRPLNEPPTTAIEVVAKSRPDEMPVVNGVCVPRHSGDVGRLAKLAFESGLAPKGSKNVPQAIMGIMAGMEVGLTFVQACRQVMVVNGSPSLWGDARTGPRR